MLDSVELGDEASDCCVIVGDMDDGCSDNSGADVIELVFCVVGAED